MIGHGIIKELHHVKHAALLEPKRPVHAGSKTPDILSKGLTVDFPEMVCGIGKRNPILEKVIADGEFAAERVATALDVNLIIFVVFRVDKEWQLQFGVFESIDHSQFVAE